jgi:hypothetical protein
MKRPAPVLAFRNPNPPAASQDRALATFTSQHPIVAKLCRLPWAARSLDVDHIEFSEREGRRMADEGDEHTPLRKQLNSSGIPFQLRVERLLHGVSRELRIAPILREVPAGGRFLDIVCCLRHVLIVFECKRVTERDWIFVTDGIRTRSECRLEYFNGAAPPFLVATPRPRDRVFVDTWLFNAELPEADFCVSPKDTADQSIELMCRQLLSGSRALLAYEEIGHGPLIVAVPVVITTAKLWLCGVKEADVDLQTGRIPEGRAGFESVQVVRFTKTFAEQVATFMTSIRWTSMIGPTTGSAQSSS